MSIREFHSRLSSTQEMSALFEALRMIRCSEHWHVLKDQSGWLEWSHTPGPDAGGPAPAQG
jgi:hypothetical protein